MKQSNAPLQVPAITSANTDALATKLESILKAANEYVPKMPQGLLPSLRGEFDEVSAITALYFHELGDEVEELIIADKRFLGNVVRVIAELGGAFGFYPQFLTPQLIVRLVESQSTKIAIEWLEKVLKTKHGDGSYVTALWNVRVNTQIEIAPGIALVPFASLPNSHQKERLHKQTFNPGPLHTALDWEEPTSALVVQHRVTPFLRDPDGPAPEHDDYFQIHSTIDDVIEALTLVGPRVPIRAASWFGFTDPDLEATRLGTGSMLSTIEILPHWSSVNPVGLDTAVATSTVSMYRALNPTTKAWIQIAISRLRNALSRHDASDSAVELSIALEVLMGDNNNNEMTHKVCVRATRMLGGSAATRTRNHTIFKKTYEIRSKLVHMGKRTDGKKMNIAGDQLTADELIAQASSLCAELIRLIISRGGAPDWSTFDISDVLGTSSAK